MKAIIARQAGGAEQLELIEQERPSPQHGEALVEIHASGVNHRDIWVRMGLQGVTFPYVLGSDAAGVVAEVGPGANDEMKSWLGRRVLIQPGWGCGQCRACLSGKDTLCPSYRMRDGSYAEYRAVPVEQLVDIGDLPFTTAASLPVPYLTAWQMVHHYLQLEPGETLLISGASGGVGTAAMQIAHLHGATVIGLTRSPKKAENLKRLGFDDVVLVEGDWPQEVLKRAGGPIDAIVDNVGQAMWHAFPSMLRRGGAIAFCGTTTGTMVEFDIRAHFAKSLRLYGTYTGPRADLPRIVELAQQGRLQPEIDKEFPLAEAAAAHQRMDAQEHLGGLVLRVRS